MIIKGETFCSCQFYSRILIVYLTVLLRKKKRSMKIWLMSNGNRHGDD